MTADPYRASAGAGDPGSWNRTAYVQGDPINYNDPNGLATCTLNGTMRVFGIDQSETWIQMSCKSSSGGVEDQTVAGWFYLASDGEIQQAIDLFGKQVDQREEVLFQNLLAASIKRVQAALLKESCAKDFRNASAVSQRAGKASFGDLGQIRFETRDGKRVSTGGSVGLYVPVVRSITLNRRINWRNPDATDVIIDGVTMPGGLLRGQALAVGASSITAEQFMDISLLHELSHYRGAIGNPDKDPTVERRLWEDCLN